MFEDHRDPYLLSVAARVKDLKDVRYVQDELLRTFEATKSEEIAPKRLADVKSNLQYGLALRMDDSEAIAETIAHYIQLRRTPETLNALYRVYAAVTADDLRALAKKYFVPEGRTIVTLSRTGGK
jgi:zinc protease